MINYPNRKKPNPKELIDRLAQHIQNEIEDWLYKNRCVIELTTEAKVDIDRQNEEEFVADYDYPDEI